LAKERIERDDEDLVRLYLTDIGQYPLLTKDDEVRLAQAIEAGREAEEELAKAPKGLTAAKKRELRRGVIGGEQAQQTFVQSNLRLVVSIAKKYQASGLPLLDLIQEGNLGLMHAVEKFDWRKGFKFSTYATWWIRQAITRGIANTGRTIRLPVHAGDTLARVQKAQARLELKLGRPATLVELGIEVEMPEDKLVEALRFRAEPLSLSEPLREDGDAELGDVVEDRSAVSPNRPSRSPPSPSCPTRSAGCSPRSTSASARSCACGSVSTAASPAPWKRWASTSTSRVSGSARSRHARCPSSVIPRRTPVPVISSRSEG
jgi:RNA polymerase sigma factor (sigma-70 family)